MTLATPTGIMSLILKGSSPFFPIMSRTLDTSSAIRLSMIRVPTPKLRNTDNVNVLCSFHSFPLLAKMPVWTIYDMHQWWICFEGAKEKYRGMFEIQKSGDKTSSGEIGLDIRTHASPKVGQDQVSRGVSVLCWHAAPVAYFPWKPCTIR